MAMRQDEVRAVAPWREHQGQFEFIRRPLPDPLTASLDEARVLALDNARLVGRVAALEGALRHNDAVFLPRLNRLLRRKDERIARAERLAWGAVALATIVVALAALACFWAMGWRGAALVIGGLFFVAAWLLTLPKRGRR